MDIKIDCIVSKYSGGKFNDDAGREVVFSKATLIVGSDVFEVSSDLDLTQYQGSRVVLNAKIVGGPKHSAKVVITGVQGKPKE